jgi:hypothetical protein
MGDFFVSLLCFWHFVNFSTKVELLKNVSTLRGTLTKTIQATTGEKKK